MANTFSKNMKYIRLSNGMTQEQFASFLGTSKQVISRYERNERSPKISAVRMFAEKMGLSISELAGDDAQTLTAPKLQYDDLPSAVNDIAQRFKVDDETARRAQDLAARLNRVKQRVEKPEEALDEELIYLLSRLSPNEIRRVIDFARGVLATRPE